MNADVVVLGRSGRPRAWRRWRRTTPGVLGAIIVALIVIAVVFGPLIAAHGAAEIIPGSELRGPSGEFWLGTDSIGRDMFARILTGMRVSLVVACIAVSSAIVLGGTTGALAGYFGGWVDAIFMRVWDALFAIPVILLGVLIVAMTGAGLDSVAVAIAIGAAPSFARITRAAVVAENAKDYVPALRGFGLSHGRVLFRHVIPNALGPLIVQAALALSLSVCSRQRLASSGWVPKNRHRPWDRCWPRAGTSLKRHRTICCFRASPFH